MRVILTILAWLFLIAAVANAALFVYALVVVAQGGWSDPWMTVEAFTRIHASFMSWGIDTVRQILPSEIAEWLLERPALILFPIRAVVTFVIANLLFRFSRR